MDQKVMTRETALQIKDRWHNVCRLYNDRQASGADMSLAFRDAARAVQKAEQDGADMSDVRRDFPHLFDA